MHLKRQRAPKNWPIKRKGTKYIVRPSFNLENGIPLLIVVRDMLKLAKNRKEVKKALHEKQILLNGKIIQDEKISVSLFDIITLLPSKEHYKMEISTNNKFILEKISESKSEKKIVKIINKKTLKNKRTQLNLGDGRNFLSNIKCKVNDSAVVDLKNKKIEKCLPLIEKAKVLIFSGKHVGKIETIDKINLERKNVGVKIEGKPVNVLIKQLMVIE